MSLQLPEQKKAHRLWVINSLWISEAFVDHQPPTNLNTCFTLTGIIFRWQICWKTLWPLQKAACFDLRVDAVDGSGVIFCVQTCSPHFFSQHVRNRWVLKSKAYGLWTNHQHLRFNRCPATFSSAGWSSVPKKRALSDVPWPHFWYRDQSLVIHHFFVGCSWFFHL